MKFRKKPVVIEAWHVSNDQMPDWLKSAMKDGSVEMFFSAAQGQADRFECGRVHTLEGVMTFNDGDWIIQGVQDEMYPCKPDIFAATYEVVE